MQRTLDIPASKKRFNEVFNESGLSVRELSSRMGFSTDQAVYKILNPKNKGYMSIDSLIAASGAFNKSLDDLVVYKIID